MPRRMERNELLCSNYCRLMLNVRKAGLLSQSRCASRIVRIRQTGARVRSSGGNASRRRSRLSPCSTSWIAICRFRLSRFRHHTVLNQRWLPRELQCESRPVDQFGLRLLKIRSWSRPARKCGPTRNGLPGKPWSEATRYGVAGFGGTVREPLHFRRRRMVRNDRVRNAEN